MMANPSDSEGAAHTAFQHRGSAIGVLARFGPRTGEYDVGARLAILSRDGESSFLSASSEFQYLLNDSSADRPLLPFDLAPTVGLGVALPGFSPVVISAPIGLALGWSPHGRIRLWIHPRQEVISRSSACRNSSLEACQWRSSFRSEIGTRLDLQSDVSLLLGVGLGDTRFHGRGVGLALRYVW